MGQVVLGVDPAKRSHAVSVVDGSGLQVAALSVGNDNAGYREMLRLARRWPQRTWAVEGAGGVGAQLAQRLVADGEHVLDVPPKLATGSRLLSVGHGRKNDPADARTIALVALRASGLRQVQPDGELVALKLLSERRSELVRARTQTVNRLHQLLMQLVPAGAPRQLTVRTAKAILGKLRPRDVAGRTRRALAVDLVDDITILERKISALDRQLSAAVEATGTTLTSIVGVGPVTAAAILGEVGDVRRFPSKRHFATYTGTAPIELSSGDVVRHRLSRAGNRRLNSALHMVALAHKRYDSRGGAYYARKLAEGKGKKGALRCLKRRLADVVFHRLTADASHQRAAGPGGHPGTRHKSSVTGSTPTASSSDKSLPGPTKHNATPALTGTS